MPRSSMDLQAKHPSRLSGLTGSGRVLPSSRETTPKYIAPNKRKLVGYDELEICRTGQIDPMSTTEVKSEEKNSSSIMQSSEPPADASETPIEQGFEDLADKVLSELDMFADDDPDPSTNIDLITSYIRENEAKRLSLKNKCNDRETTPACHEKIDDLHRALERAQDNWDDLSDILSQRNKKLQELKKLVTDQELLVTMAHQDFARATGKITEAVNNHHGGCIPQPQPSLKNEYMARTSLDERLVARLKRWDRKKRQHRH